VNINIPENRIAGAEITSAELGAAGFESFMDTGYGIKAYVLSEVFDKTVLDKLIICNSDEFGKCSFVTRNIEDTNWNAIWEAEYEPVSIPGFCYIRSPFHQPERNHQHEIIIEPKMSFGTGHHETTWLMIDLMQKVDFKEKTVLDLGSGTGVLSIMASLLEARDVTGIDKDKWAYENSLENLQINNINNCKILHGDISVVEGETYDIILANITRNINLEYMPHYKALCRKGTNLLLSGFYFEDLDKVRSVAGNFSFSYIDHKIKKNWVSVLFISQE